MIAIAGASGVFEEPVPSASFATGSVSAVYSDAHNLHQLSLYLAHVRSIGSVASSPEHIVVVTSAVAFAVVGDIQAFRLSRSVVQAGPVQIQLDSQSDRSTRLTDFSRVPVWN